MLAVLAVAPRTAAAQAPGDGNPRPADALVVQMRESFVQGNFRDVLEKAAEVERISPGHPAAKMYTEWATQRMKPGSRPRQVFRYGVRDPNSTLVETIAAEAAKATPVPAPLVTPTPTVRATPAPAPVAAPASGVSAWTSGILDSMSDASLPVKIGGGAVAAVIVLLGVFLVVKKRRAASAEDEEEGGEADAQSPIGVQPEVGSLSQMPTEISPLAPPSPVGGSRFGSILGDMSPSLSPTAPPPNSPTVDEVMPAPPERPSAPAHKNQASRMQDIILQ
jgi:hypothetical protein